MATLELEFNCMCLFVTDPEDGTVHVLMPPTAHDHADHGNAGLPATLPRGLKRHVVRLLHRSFAADQGRSLEGWALELHGSPAPPDTTLLRPAGGQNPEVVDLSGITNRRVSRDHLEREAYPNRVSALLTLRGGTATKLDDEDTKWVMDGRTIVMAHQVVWRLENVSEQLRWVDLGANHGPPLRSLSELEAEADGSYRLEVYHVTEKALPPTGLGYLNAAEVRKHFGAFYPLLGFKPGARHLPRLKPGGKEGGKYNCKTAQAELESASPHPGEDGG